MGIEDKIENGHLLTDIFGRFPSFHDAEVVKITLDRGDRNNFRPTLEAAIHVFEMTSEVDAEGRYILKNHVLVRFRFSEIRNVSLADFNQQNVLQYLEIAHLSDRAQDKVRFKVTLGGIFGVTAEFHCRAVSVEGIEPFTPERS